MEIPQSDPNPHLQGPFELNDGLIVQAIEEKIRKEGKVEQAFEALERNTQERLTKIADSLEDQMKTGVEETKQRLKVSKSVLNAFLETGSSLQSHLEQIKAASLVLPSPSIPILPFDNPPPDFQESPKLPLELVWARISESPQAITLTVINFKQYSYSNAELQVTSGASEEIWVPLPRICPGAHAISVKTPLPAGTGAVSLVVWRMAQGKRTELSGSLQIVVMQTPRRLWASEK